MYNMETFSATITDALALYFQLGTEWQNGAQVIVRKGNVEYRVLKPRGLL